MKRRVVYSVFFLIKDFDIFCHSVEGILVSLWNSSAQNINLLRVWCLTVTTVTKKKESVFLSITIQRGLMLIRTQLHVFRTHVCAELKKYKQAPSLYQEGSLLQRSSLTEVNK